jgi:putative ABC transport system permease protein
VRTGVTVAAIALALSLAITMSSLPYSFQESMNSYVGKFLGGDLIVSAVATEGGWLETPVPETLARELAEIPGVTRVEAGRALPGQPFREARIGILAATDGVFEPSRLPDGWYRQGDPHVAAEALRAGRGVNVSTTLADRYGFEVGDEIELQTPSGSLRLPIMGVVPDFVSDHGSVIMGRRLFVDRWRERTLSRINVFADGSVSLEELRKRIVARFGERYRLKVLSVGEVLQYHDRMIRRAFAFTDAIQLLIAIVTVCGIFDLLVSTIIERRRELALWRVIGADDRAVRGSVVLEAGTVGALGALLGLGVGLVTAWLWIKINLRYLLGYDLEYHFGGLPTALSVLIVVLMTIAAGYAAARMATSQSVLDGIRNE